MKSTSAQNICCHEHFPMIKKHNLLVDLDLAPRTKVAAATLEAKFPGKVTFASGRRSVSDQAKAMAANIVKSGDRKWIEKTYAQSPARKELQDWVDAHPEAQTEAEISYGLLGIMNGWDEAKRKTISYHIVGAAFDIAVVSGTTGDQIKNFIRKNLPDLNKFLESEGGLIIWHLQFNE